MIKRIFFKALLIFLVLSVSNGLYKTWFFESDIQEHAPIVNLVRNIPKDAQIVYFGESSNNTFSGDDLDKSSIADFIGRFYPDMKLYGITKHAAHAGVFKVLIEHIPENHSIKTVVVTMNLRSFNAQWIYSDLETALQKSLVLLKPYPPLLNRFLLSFKAYDIKTPEERAQQVQKQWAKDLFKLPFSFPFKNVNEWDAYVWKEGVKNPDGTSNEALKELKCHYIKAYAFQIDTVNNPRIHDFDHIVKLAKRRNWNIVFNIVAENTQKAYELVGPDLVYMMNENAQLLDAYFSRKGAVVVNNLNAVPDDEFIDQNWTTEHYAEFGRRTIAQQVAVELKRWHAENFRQSSINEKFKTEFFNDCEGGTPWGQSHTISDEKAYSGKFASRVVAGNEYSITWEYPLSKIPDSLKNSINLSFRFFKAYKIEQATLVIEAQGEQTGNYWLGFKLDQVANANNQWRLFKKTLTMDDRLRRANLIKIYVYNPTKMKLYVDDFRIQLE